MRTDQRTRPHEHKPHQVYLLRDRAGAVLYVGATSDLRQRIAVHRREKPWRREIDPGMTVSTDPMPWEEARALEEQCIERFEPRYNHQRTNGAKYAALGLRKYRITEDRLVRQAKTGDPAALAALQTWRAEQAQEAARRSPVTPEALALLGPLIGADR